MRVSGLFSSLDDDALKRSRGISMKSAFLRQVRWYGRITDGNHDQKANPRKSTVADLDSMLNLGRHGLDQRIEGILSRLCGLIVIPGMIR